MTQNVSSRDPVDWIRSSFDSELAGAIKRLRKRGPRVDLHGARKQLKRTRAELRLLREVFGEVAYRKLNGALRDSARPLSDARDAQVLLLTLNSVAGDKLRSGRKLTRLRKTLRAEQLNHQRAAAKRVAAVSKRVARKRLDAQKLDGRQSGWRPIGVSLKRTYRRGRKALMLARKETIAEHLHEWRKQVKYYWHQLEVLEQLAPSIGGNKVRRLHKLSNHLGDNHDLFVLRTRLARSSDEELDEPSRLQLQTRIDHERKRLQRKAFALGSRLYSEKPKQLERRVADYP